MTISSSCHLSGEAVRVSTSVTVSNLLQKANEFLKIPGGLSRAKDILEMIHTLSPDRPEADLLQSRILDREGDSIGASQILGEVKRNEPLAVACEEIPVENDSNLRLRVGFDPDVESHIQEALFELDPRYLIKLATAVSYDPYESLEATFNLLESGKADLENLNALLLEELEKVGLNAAENSFNKYFERLMKITNATMRRFKFTIIQELPSHPVLTDSSQLEEVRRMICLGVVQHAMIGVQLDR